MPKYSLDEKGILTITSDCDEGIFSIGEWLKRIVRITTTILVIIIVVLYLVRYASSLNTDYMINILERQFSGLDISSNFSKIYSKFNISYLFVSVVENAKGQSGFYTWLFRTIAHRAEQLVCVIRDTIQNIIN